MSKFLKLAEKQLPYDYNLFLASRHSRPPLVSDSTPATAGKVLVRLLLGNDDLHAFQVLPAFSVVSSSRKVFQVMRLSQIP